MKYGTGIHYHKTGVILFLFLAFAALAAWAPRAEAYGSYFTPDCGGCHVGQTGADAGSGSFCGTCHAHGVHASSSKTGINVTASTDKTSYAPGETVSVTIRGGYRSNSARAVLYDQNMAQVAVSTGTPSSGGAPVNAPVWPRTLTASAPTAPGTYTWRAAWYGNLNDSGSATFGGANWVLDANNPDHGEERVSVSVVVLAAAAPTISTASPLAAGTVGTAYSQTFAATGGTTPYSWSASTGLPAGLTFTAGVLSGTPTTTGAYGFTVQVTGGNGASSTKSFSLAINAGGSTGAFTVMPPDGAKDVQINTVVTATVDGTQDIKTLFNKDTFTLKPTVDTEDSSVGMARPLAATVCVREGVVQGSFAYDTANTTATFTPNCELRHSATYVGTIASSGAGTFGSSPAGTFSWRFTTVADGPDSDEDGAPDDEDDYPRDKKKSSRWGSKGKGKIHIDASDTEGTSLKVVMAISDTSARLNHDGKPKGYEFPDGLVAFHVEGVTSGGTATAKVTFPSGIPAGSKVYQADENGFHEVAGAVVNGNTLTMTLAARQDNGIVVDPIGVASPEATGSGSLDLSTSSSSGGCSVAGTARSGGGLREMAESYGFLILTVLGMALRGRVKRKEK
jgi:hypothetical protein